MVKEILLGIAMLAALDSIAIDEVRLRAERLADADVLSSLQSNGDCPSVVRQIDLRFVGSKRDVDKFSTSAESFGFTVIQTVGVPGGDQAVDLATESDVLASSIEKLTLLALRIENHFKLRYDGWGTVAVKC